MERMLPWRSSRLDGRQYDRRRCGSSSPSTRQRWSPTTRPTSSSTPSAPAIRSHCPAVPHPRPPPGSAPATERPEAAQAAAATHPRRLRRRRPHRGDRPPPRRQSRHGVEHRRQARRSAQPASQPRRTGRARRPLVRRRRHHRRGTPTITRIGCRTRQPGLRSLADLDPAIADDVMRRLIECSAAGTQPERHPTSEFSEKNGVSTHRFL